MSRKPRRQPGDNSFHWTLQRNLPFTYHSVLRISRAGSPALYCTEYSVHQPVPAVAYSYNLFYLSSGCSRRWSTDKTGKKWWLMVPVTSFQGVFFSSICSHISNTELCVFSLLASIALVVWRISSLLSMMVQMFCITLDCPLLLSSNSPEVALWCLSLYL